MTERPSEAARVLVSNEPYLPSKVDEMKLADAYDVIMFREDALNYFGGSNFTNFGYWDDDTADQRSACENLMEKLLERLPSRSGTILDVACGKGGSTRYLQQYLRPECIHASNISHNQIHAARENAPGSSFSLCDAARLPFASESFDTVLCVEAAFHFEYRETFLEESHRVLNPGGTVVLSDLLMAREAERRRTFRHEGNYLKDLDAYCDMLDRIGYVHIEVQDVTQECWHGCYWFAVQYIHQAYLNGDVTLEKLQWFLQLTYGRAEDTEYYLIASARKREGH